MDTSSMDRRGEVLEYPSSLMSISATDAGRASMATIKKQRGRRFTLQVFQEPRADQADVASTRRMARRLPPVHRLFARRVGPDQVAAWACGRSARNQVVTARSRSMQATTAKTAAAR